LESIIILALRYQKVLVLIDPAMGYELLYLPPADESPTKADISQGFIIRWTLMNKNGVL
jgi:hypothetical protein